MSKLLQEELAALADEFGPEDDVLELLNENDADDLEADHE